MHEAIRQVLRFFTFNHLSDDAREVSAKCSNLAHDLVLPVERGGMGLTGPEATVGLRKLLEAKDCFVRASLPDPEKQEHQ